MVGIAVVSVRDTVGSSNNIVVRVIKSLKSIQSGQTTRREYVPRRGGLTNWC